MLIFQDSQYLNLLFALPIIVTLYIGSVIRTKRRLKRLGETKLIEALMPDRSIIRQHLKFTLQLFVLALIIFILARPQYGTKQTKETNKGIEAVIMLDVSNSMRARDLSPSRLDRAKMMVENLVDQMKNDKIAIGVFAGEAYPQMPITSDYASAKLFLEAVNPNMVTLQGTNLGAAIKLAEKSFTDNKNIGKAIILITDGENHEPGSLEAAKEAAAHDINIFIVGVGTTQGAEIPTESGPLTDIHGEIVHTALNETMCKETAKAGKGIYLHLDQTNNAQEELLNQFSLLKQSATETQSTERDEQFQAIGLIALFVLLLEMFTQEKKSRLFSKFHLFKSEK